MPLSSLPAAAFAVAGEKEGPMIPDLYTLHPNGTDDAEGRIHADSWEGALDAAKLTARDLEVEVTVRCSGAALAVVYPGGAVEMLDGPESDVFD